MIYFIIFCFVLPNQTIQDQWTWPQNTNQSNTQARQHYIYFENIFTILERKT